MAIDGALLCTVHAAMGAVLVHGLSAQVRVISGALAGGCSTAHTATGMLAKQKLTPMAPGESVSKTVQLLPLAPGAQAVRGVHVLVPASQAAAAAAAAGGGASTVAPARALLAEVFVYAEEEDGPPTRMSVAQGSVTPRRGL